MSRRGRHFQAMARVNSSLVTNRSLSAHNAVGGRLRSVVFFHEARVAFGSDEEDHSWGRYEMKPLVRKGRRAQDM